MKTLTALLFAMLCITAHAEENRLDMNEAVKACEGSPNDDCVVRYFKNTLEASEIRGGLVYMNYCKLCHGAEGKGDGRIAKLYTPPPYDLTLSMAPKAYVTEIIRKGGEAMKRGPAMPPWEEQLTDEQIKDVVNYLYTIRINKP